MRESLLGGIHAAALVLACVFLASAAVRREVDSLAAGLALLALAGTAWFLAGWLTDEHADSAGWRRVRGGLLVVAAGIAVSLVVRGTAFMRQLTSGRSPSSGTASAPTGAAASRLLLVTTGPAPAGTEAGAALGDLVAPGVLVALVGVHASPRRDPALASVLTGLEVLEHRVLFDGDTLPDRARTVLEVFRDEGAATAAFGGERLPAWAARGAEQVERAGGLRDAVLWLARVDAGTAVAVAHVHVDGALGPDADVLAAFAGRPGAFVLALDLPAAKDAEVPDLTPAECASTLVFSAASEPDGAAFGRAVVSVPATLLEAAALDALPEHARPSSLQGAPDEGELLAVTFRHGRAGAVHVARGFAPFGGGVAVLTPLGGFTIEGRDPRALLDDWRADDALAGHLVYRNEIRPEVVGRARFVDALARWRARNGAFEARPRVVVGPK